MSMNVKNTMYVRTDDASTQLGRLHVNVHGDTDTIRQLTGVKVLCLFC